jgi:predicted RNase H-like HicB family nuclease/DNA-binding XRE family transcriptional regulator
MKFPDTSSNDSLEDEEFDDEERESVPFTEEELAEARHFSILIQWSPEQDIYMASSPEFPQLKTHGETQEEALDMGVEVIALWLSVLRDDGEPLPQPNYFYLEPKGLSASDIRDMRKRLGVSQERFARALNVSVSSVRAWEQGLRQPDGPTVRLLELADRHPEILMETARSR